MQHYGEPDPINPGSVGGADIAAAEAAPAAEPEGEGRWTEGVCGDGAAILFDGAMVPIEEVVRELNGRPATLPAPEQGEVEECPHCGYEGEMAPVIQAGDVAVPEPVSERLRQIGDRLRNQDNRCTANPIFLVRGKERIYGLDSSASDEIVWMDDEWNPVEIPEGADPEEPPHGLTVARYTTRWKALMVAFTEQGCKEHLRLNGHNYRIYDEVGIYVDSLNRCPEMIAIREFLLGLPAPQPGAVQP